MTNHMVYLKRLRQPALLAGVILVLPFAGAASAQQFFAEPQYYGDVKVVDAEGAEVPIVNGDPVGTRPRTCPSDSYYFNELDSDKAQLVLTDCATGDGAFTVSVLN